MFVIEIIILFESPSLPMDNEKSFVRYESSSDDSEATLSVLVSPQSVLPSPVYHLLGLVACL